MHFTIFTSPSFQKGKFVSETLSSTDQIIAADCGARSALRQNITPKVVIGDFDSLNQTELKELKTKGTKLIKSPKEKDETDTQLAIEYAIENGASKISLIGGVEGDRIEHSVANIFLVYNPKVKIELVNGPSKTWAVKGPRTISINGTKNDFLSLFSLTPEVTEIKTKGLFYPLNDETLYFGVPRGISNVFKSDKTSISFKTGILLFVHTNTEELR